MSQSFPAVKEFLAARQAQRSGRYVDAIEGFDQAIALDSTFALAALFLGEAGFWLGTAPEARQAGVRGPLLAWRLRDRLSERDRAYLETFWSVGTNYPGPYTHWELTEATRRAIDLAPHRPELWILLAQQYLYFGTYFGMPDWKERALEAVERAFNLDSTLDKQQLGVVLEAAIVETDAEKIRTTLDLMSLGAGAAAGDACATFVSGCFYQWYAAKVLGDSAMLERVRPSLRTAAWFDHAGVVSRSIIDGLPLDDAEWVAHALADSTEAQSKTVRFMLYLAQGRMAEAIDLAEGEGGLDGVSVWWVTRLLDQAFIGEAGFGGVTDRLRAAVDSLADATGWHLYTCYHELWRTANGDTTTVREAIDRLSEQFREDNRISACPALLAAYLEELTAVPGAPRPWLEELDSLMQTGPSYFGPGFYTTISVNTFANLLVARMREREGNLPAALAAIRRRPRIWGIFITATLPAYLREEGRLAALMGDTLGAISAYDHYLTLRTKPDPAVLPQVDSVRAELAALVGEPRGEN
jgi:hypothetical protein